MSKRGRFDSGNHSRGGGGVRPRTGFGGPRGAGFERLFVDDNPWAPLEKRMGLPRIVGFIYAGKVNSDTRGVIAALVVPNTTDTLTDDVNVEAKGNVVVERVEDFDEDAEENERSDDEEDADDACAERPARPLEMLS